MQDVAVGYEHSKWAVQLAPFFRLGESFGPLMARLSQLKLRAAAPTSPLDAFLVSEVAFTQQLVANLASDFSSLSDLVKGSGILTPALQVSNIPTIVYSSNTVDVSVTTLGCDAAKRQEAHALRPCRPSHQDNSHAHPYSQAQTARSSCTLAPVVA